MKNKFLFSLIALSLLGLGVSSCSCSNETGNNGKTPDTTDKTGDEGNTDDPKGGDDKDKEEKLCIATFYPDFNNTDAEDVFEQITFDTRTGHCPAPTKGIPPCPDPAYPTWLGWSLHSQVNSLEQIYNFEDDTVRYGTVLLTFYGTWVSE